MKLTKTGTLVTNGKEFVVYLKPDEDNLDIATAIGRAARRAYGPAARVFGTYSQNQKGGNLRVSVVRGKHNAVCDTDANYYHG